MAENQSDDRFAVTTSPKITHRTHWESARRNAERFGERTANATRRANFGDVRESGRIFQPRHSCVVLGRTFRIVHRMEGRWGGVVQGGQQSSYLTNCALIFMSDENKGNGNNDDGVAAYGPHWLCDESITTPSGVTRRTRSRWIPVSDGVLHVVNENGNENNVRTELKEIGGDLMLSRTISENTGRCLRLETLTVLDEHTVTTRAKVTQIFHGEQMPVQVISVIESRVDMNDGIVPSGSIPEMSL